MRSYAASRWAIYWKLRLPASMPYLFTALKIAATASIVGTIIGEDPGGIQQGLGRAIVNFNQQYITGPGEAVGDDPGRGLARASRSSWWSASSRSIALRGTAGDRRVTERHDRRGAAASRPDGSGRPSASGASTWSSRLSDGPATVALEDIDLDIQPGEFVSLIGPSGCGKSTLLRIVGDLIAADRRHGRGQRQARATRPARPRLRDGLPGARCCSTGAPWRTNVELPLEVMGIDKRTRERAGQGDARPGRAGRLRPSTTRTSCRAACSNASRSPGRSRSSRRCC